MNKSKKVTPESHPVAERRSVENTAQALGHPRHGTLVKTAIARTTWPPRSSRWPDSAANQILYLFGSSTRYSTGIYNKMRKNVHSSSHRASQKLSIGSFGSKLRRASEFVSFDAD